MRNTFKWRCFGDKGSIKMTFQYLMFLWNRWTVVLLNCFWVEWARELMFSKYYSGGWRGRNNVYAAICFSFDILPDAIRYYVDISLGVFARSSPQFPTENHDVLEVIRICIIIYLQRWNYSCIKKFKMFQYTRTTVEQ